MSERRGGRLCPHLLCGGGDIVNEPHAAEWKQVFVRFACFSLECGGDCVSVFIQV